MQIASTKRAPSLKAYTRKLDEGEQLGNMKDLLKSGDVRSYSQEGDTVTVYAQDKTVLNDLPIDKQPRFNLRQKVEGFLKPNQLERDCAPEYATWRKWNLAASTLSGVIGFMASSVFLDAQNASYSNSEAVAMSGVLTGTLGKITQAAASPLAKFGDSDPKKSYLRSQLVATATSSAALGILGAIPGGHFPVFCGTSIVGTVGSTIGAAAGANIFSHLVPGPTKGDVTTKNANQNLIASLWGMPVGFALGRLAKIVGLPPGVLGACILGPLKAFCHVQAGRALKMNPAGAADLANIAEEYLEKGEPSEASGETLKETLKGLFQRRKKTQGRELPFVDSLEEAVGKDSQFTLDLFADEKYLLSMDKDNQVHIGLSQGAKSEDAFRACLHFTMLEKARESGLPEALKAMGRRDVSQDLVKLTKRALPKSVEVQSLLSKKGWHLSLSNFGFPLIKAEWGHEKEPEEAQPVRMETLRKLLVESPDPALLKACL
jgi:hypothetical protein